MSYSTEINKLIAEGSKLYATKEFDQASGKYADACEAFNIEHQKDDADLLLLYGKALFQSAVLNSEVFGGNPSNDNDNKKDDSNGQGDKNEQNNEDDGNFQFHDDAPLAEEDDDQINDKDDIQEEAEGEESEEEQEEEEEEENDQGNENDEQDGEEQEQSDFEIAWEILDLTRSLFEEKINDIKLKDSFQELTPPYLKSDNEETSNDFIILTKKLSETYDLLGEVSLESENFQQSALDLQNCLDLRLKLYKPENSSLISESHYKLSLALEFCIEDPKLRLKAAEQVKLAIDSIKLRNSHETDSKKKKENSDLIKDLLVRYQELEKDPAEELQLQQMDIIKGILGEATSQSAEGSSSSSKKSVQSIPTITPAINDLSSMVKKRKPAKSSSGSKDAKKQKK